MKTLITLTAGQRRVISRGHFVRVDEGTGSVLVGRVAGGFRAYVNLCRHRALPLDLGADSAMSDDGRFLLCRQHGALYRPDDGVCVAGPCAGERLADRSIEETGGGLLLGEAPEEGNDRSAADDAAHDPRASRYPFVAIDVDGDEVESAGTLLFELGAAGVEQRDATTLVRGAGAAGAKVTLLGSFERHEDATAAANDLPGAWQPRVDAIVGDGWRDDWKKYFEPFRLADGIVVSPPWRSYEARSGERVITLEPGRAFGTGLHETTALVADVLVDRLARLRGAPILDVGCGSGILSLVALVLGASRARALDVDPDAVLVTRENAARNGLAQAIVADDAPLSTIRERYETVVANIESSTLVELAPSLQSCVARGGLLVLSGILTPEAAPRQLDDVRRAFRGLHDEEVRSRGEWVAVVLGG